MILKVGRIRELWDFLLQIKYSEKTYSKPNKIILA